MPPSILSNAYNGKALKIFHRKDTLGGGESKVKLFNPNKYAKAYMPEIEACASETLTQISAFMRTLVRPQFIKNLLLK
jgi:hypothetical protein